MTTSAMTALQVLEAYGAAWNRRDAEACGALFTDDGVREWMVKPVTGTARFAGREAVTAGIGAFMTIVPDITVEMGRMWEIPGGAVLEWRVVGTHGADWDVWTAQGEPVEFPGVSVYRIKDGRIAEERMYWDTGLMTAAWRPTGT